MKSVAEHRNPVVAPETVDRSHDYISSWGDLLQNADELNRAGASYTAGHASPTVIYGVGGGVDMARQNAMQASNAHRALWHNWKTAEFSYLSPNGPSYDIGVVHWHLGSAKDAEGWGEEWSQWDLDVYRAMRGHDIGDGAGIALTAWEPGAHAEVLVVEPLSPEAGNLERSYLYGHVVGSLEDAPARNPVGYVSTMPAQTRTYRLDYSRGTDKRYMAGIAKRAKSRGVKSEYQDRVAELVTYGLHEGVQVNEDSERDFSRFVTSGTPKPGGGLALLDNGNLRATWQNGDDQLAIEFHGNGDVEYVVIWMDETGSYDGVARRCNIHDFWAAYEGMDVAQVIHK